ncbi:hypothetical protein [Paenimyroides baculatum]|uniref:Uncharacterized protein n=1 Tax=Paenimyroides baculatum TaxID=2608000 RepID=A0A5M6CI97_9FLAO|nr:hypothetical protein [Paenimyroides baculatum]KAA5532819.1 hypothetical protein F0460_13325 [Paenimyroides baculatum]
MDVTIDINIPDTWNLLTDDQLKRIAKAQNLKGDLFDLAVWLILNNAHKYNFVKKHKLKAVLQLVPLSELKTHYKFIYEDVKREKFIDLVGYKKPLDRLFDFSIERFSYADGLFNKFLETNDYNYLQHLTAVLYLKKNEVFNWDLQNQRAKRFKRLPKHILIAVHLCYSGCKNHLVKKYPKVYPKVISQQKKSNGNHSFLDVVLSMSGQKFGTYNETKATRLHTFMSEFTNTIITQEKWKEK